jgi:hypothetical protein
MTTRVLLLLTISLSAVDAYAHLVRLPTEAVQSLNWGTIFQPSHTVHLITHHWGHTFSVKLPRMPEPRTQTTFEIVCSQTGQVHSANTLNCTVASPIVRALGKFHRDSAIRLKRTIRHIHNLFPVDIRSQAHRTSRAWFGIVGRISKSLFGTATEKDMNVLQQAISKIQKQGANAINQFEIATHSFASMTKVTNARLSNLVELVIEISHFVSLLQTMHFNFSLL